VQLTVCFSVCYNSGVFSCSRRRLVQVFSQEEVLYLHFLPGGSALFFLTFRSIGLLSQPGGGAGQGRDRFGEKCNT
jgi:hypothetical protein